MEKKTSIQTIKFLIHSYIFLFIFTMFNREFYPLGLDLRYMQIVIALTLIIYKIGKYFKECRKSDKGERVKRFIAYTSNEINALGKIVLIFYTYILIVNLRWINNGLVMNKVDFINMIILNIYNCISILVFILYRKEIEVTKVIKYIMIGATVLFISMLLVLIGFRLPQIMGGDYPGLFIGGEQFNFFGKAYRIAGYAQDPNYCSMFMIITGITAFYYIKNKFIKYGMVIISVTGYMLAASKTLLLALIFIFVIGIIINKFKSTYIKLGKYFERVFVVCICVFPYIVMKIFSIFNINLISDSMNTRLLMWNNAIELFEKSPIFGSGITSFRSHFLILTEDWYVHCHSTIFQLLSETGVIGLILFGLLIATILKINNKYSKIIILLFSIFSLTYELLYLSLFAFVIGLVPLIALEFDKKELYT